MSADKITLREFIAQLEQGITDGRYTDTANVVCVRHYEDERNPEYDGVNIHLIPGTETRDGWLLIPDPEVKPKCGVCDEYGNEMLLVISPWTGPRNWMGSYR